MRLYFLLARHTPPVPSPLLVEVARQLRARGFEVESGTPEEMLVEGDRLAPSHDLYVLKSHTELALSLAASLYAQGARILNPVPACAAAHDKVLAVQRLRTSGVPVPRTYVTGDIRRIRELLENCGPLVIKPLRGYYGVGVHLVRSSRDLVALPPLDGPVMVQELVSGPGEDLKVYVVGTRVRTRAAFGLDLFGVDVIESPDGPSSWT